MASQNKPKIEVIITDGQGRQFSRTLDLFDNGGGTFKGADHIPNDGANTGGTVQVILTPLAGGETIKQISDKLHQLRTGITRTTP